jgi:hypothetical protein
MMSEHINVKPKISLEDDGCSYTIDNKEFINLIDKKYKLLDVDYNLNLIKKYC